MYKFQLLGFSKRPTVKAPDESTAVAINILSVLTYFLYIIQIVVVSISSWKRNYYEEDGKKVLCGPLRENETL